MRMIWVAAIVVMFAGCNMGDMAAREPNAPRAGQEASVAKKKEVLQVKEHKSGEWSPELSEEEKATLFAIVEDTLKMCVTQPDRKFSFEEYAITEKMKKDTATFVTLKIKGMLRGCIGSLVPVAPMYQSVHDNAILAALRDHRFRPVSERELGMIDVSISILSPVVEIDSLEEFRIGEHGIILTKGRARSVYLPEVAVEQGWNKEETLSSLSQKAGLSSDGWRNGASFQVFSSVGLSK